MEIWRPIIALYVCSHHPSSFIHDIYETSLLQFHFMKSQVITYKKGCMLVCVEILTPGAGVLPFAIESQEQALEVTGKVMWY